MKSFLFAIFMVSCISCSTSRSGGGYYYECIADKGYYLLDKPKSSALYGAYVPAGSIFYTKSSPKKSIIKVQVGTEIGYLYKPTFTKRVRSIFTTIPSSVALDQDNLIFKGSHGRLYYHYFPRERSDNISSGYSGGTVQVKGYYRKNGTYVRPYTRRAPSRH
jgi:hypothetical protein